MPPLPFGRRAVYYPSEAERRFSQGACLYACRQGHAWQVFLARSEDLGGFVLLDPADAYCEHEDCSELDDQQAQGQKISHIRHWQLRGELGWRGSGTSRRLEVPLTPAGRASVRRYFAAADAERTLLLDARRERSS